MNKCIIISCLVISFFFTLNKFLVTEREVIQGILKAENPNDHCLCYVDILFANPLLNLGASYKKYKYQSNKCCGKIHRYC